MNIDLTLHHISFTFEETISPWVPSRAVGSGATTSKDTYPYWHQEKRGLDFDGMMAGIQKMKETT